MRVATLALVVLAGAALASGPRQPVGQRVRTSTGVQVAASKLGPPAFTFADGTSGLPYASTLCDALTAADKVGNWWCLAGDGTMATGSQVTLTASGTPAAATARSVCPSGPACATATMQRLDGVDDKYESGNVASPAGDFTACWFGAIETSAASTLLINRSGVGANANVQFYTGGTPTVLVVDVYKSGGSTSLAAGSASITTRAHQLHCAAYDFITDGTSVLKIYTDGTEVGTTSAAVGPPLSASIPWTVNANKFNGGGWLNALNRGSFVTETYLSAARIAQLARAVLADTPTGTKGEALTFTRATASSCALDANESELTYLPSGRPCITRGGLSVYRAGTNLALRSEEFDNAAWTKAGSGAAAPTVTANAAIAPDGTMTADRVEVAACPTSGNFSVVYQSTGSKTHALWLKGNASTPSVSICSSVGGGSCSPKTLTTEWKRYSLDNAVAGITVFGCDNEATLAGSSNTGAADFFAWGAQATSDAHPSPYVRTTTASVTRNAEVPSFSVGAPGLTTASLAATIVSTPTANGGLYHNYLRVRASAGDSIALVGNNASDDMFLEVNETQTRAAGASPYGGPSTAKRIAGWLDGANITAKVESTSASAAQTQTPANTAKTLYVGSNNAGTNQADGIISDTCYDASPSRCR